MCQVLLFKSEGACGDVLYNFNFVLFVIAMSMMGLVCCCVLVAGAAPRMLGAYLIAQQQQAC